MKTTLSILLGIFLFIGLKANSQEIRLNAPARTLCYGENYFIHFDKMGDFSLDDEFILFTKLNDSTEVEQKRTQADSISVADLPSSSIFIRSSISKITSNVISLNVDKFPNLFLQYSSEPFCEGYFTEIEIYSGLIGGEQISWFKDEELIPDESGSILKASESGIYTAKVQRKSCKYEVLGKAKIEVGQIKQAKISTTHSPEICSGYSLNINSELPSLSDLSLQWLLDGDSLPVAYERNYIAEKSGSYQLVVKQGKCQSVSDPIIVNTGNLTPSKIQVLPNNFIGEEISICDSMEISLRTDNYFGRKDIEIGWLKDGIHIPFTNQNQINVSEPGVYRYRLKQGNCEILSSPLKVKIGDYTGMTAQSLTDFESCAGKQINLLAVPQNSTLINAITDLELWNETGGKVQNVSYIYGLANVKKSGNYYFKGNLGSNCSIYSDTVQIKLEGKEVPFNLVLDAQKVQTCADSVVLGSKLKITGLNSASTYTWRFKNETIKNATKPTYTAKESGSYSLNIKVDSSCTYISNPLDIQFNTLNASVVPSTLALCVGHLNELQVQTGSASEIMLNSFGEAIEDRDLHIQWYKETTPLNKLRKQKITESGAYSANVKTGDCEVNTDTLNVKLTQLNGELIPNVARIGICPNGGSVLLESSEIADNYQWLNDSLNYSSSTFQLEADKPGIYRVWFEKDGCFKVSNEIRVEEQFELPTASLSGSTEVQYGEKATLKVDFTGSGPWSFENEQNQDFTTLENPYFYEVEPSNTGLYTLRKVSNPCGSGTTFGEVRVKVLVLGTEIENELNFTVFPNPTINRLRVQLPENKKFEANYDLINLQGRIILSGKLNQTQNEIRLPLLSSGIYMLKLNTTDHKTYERKILINP